MPRRTPPRLLCASLSTPLRQSSGRVGSGTNRLRSQRGLSDEKVHVTWEVTLFDDEINMELKNNVQYVKIN